MNFNHKVTVSNLKKKQVSNQKPKYKYQKHMNCFQTLRAAIVIKLPLVTNLDLFQSNLEIKIALH